MTLDNKTIAEWHKDIRLEASYFANKYENSFQKVKYDSKIVEFYRKNFNTYIGLSEVLHHLHTYGSLVHKTRCLACQNDRRHVENLRSFFNRFYPFIIRCKDGEQFQL